MATRICLYIYYVFFCFYPERQTYLKYGLHCKAISNVIRLILESQNIEGY